MQVVWKIKTCIIVFWSKKFFYNPGLKCCLDFERGSTFLQRYLVWESAKSMVQSTYWRDSKRQPAFRWCFWLLSNSKKMLKNIKWPEIDWILFYLKWQSLLLMEMKHSCYASAFWVTILIFILLLFLRVILAIIDHFINLSLLIFKVSRYWCWCQY